MRENKYMKKCRSTVFVGLLVGVGMALAVRGGPRERRRDEDVRRQRGDRRPDDHLPLGT